MPYVNIKVTKNTVTQTQKEQLIKGVSVLLQNVLNKSLKSTVVVIDEMNTDNWGIDGKTVSSRRK